MWQLIAEGKDPRQRWKHRLEQGRAYLVGRSVNTDLPVPWEPLLSSKHFEVVAIKDDVAKKEVIEVRQLEKVRNPIYLDGVAAAQFRMSAGQRFVVGQTSFILRELQSVMGSPNAPVQEVTFTRQELQRVHFEDADRRLEALARLPAAIGRASSRHETAQALVSLILAGIKQADVAAVVKRKHRRRGDHAVGQEIEITTWDRRNETAGTFRPSAKLVKEALHEQRSILNVWDNSTPLGEHYTATADFDWAFCTPVSKTAQESWGIYVAGSLDHIWAGGENAKKNLQADVRFAQLVGEILNSAEKMNQMEGQLSVLRQFLSPPLLSVLERDSEHGLNTDLLNPKVCDVTVLFCDLRGFSHHAEEMSEDLPGLLSRVSGALEVMTKEILDHGGVTGDFLGDAVLGFWGWPFASDDAPLKACRAALAIRNQFSQIQANPQHPLSDFNVGIGVAHGRAIAGKIGTSGRMTVTVFGPVVNLASRLEGMTKKLLAPILLDEVTAKLARAGFTSEEGRVRQLASVLPYGMEKDLVVSELVPPLGEFSELTDEQLLLYEEGVRQFIAGNWNAAYQALHGMPPSDRAQDFLMSLITQHHRTAPQNWTGTIPLPSK